MPNAYPPGEIGLSFIVDGDLTMDLVPGRAVAGRVTLPLGAYRKHIAGNARGCRGVAGGLPGRWAERGGARAPATA